MMITMLDVLRNIYSAGGGAAHPSAVSSALFALMWNTAWKDAVAAGQAAHDAGADDVATSRAFHQSFAETLGWSEAQSAEFWRHHGDDPSAHDAQAFDEAWDAFDDFVTHMRRGRR